MKHVGGNPLFGPLSLSLPRLTSFPIVVSLFLFHYELSKIKEVIRIKKYGEIKKHNNEKDSNIQMNIFELATPDATERDVSRGTKSSLHFCI